MPDANPASSTCPILWSRSHEVKKTFLMHSDQILTATDGFTTIKSLCYRVGRSPGCILFDVSSRQDDQAVFLSILAAQFLKLWGTAFHQENKQRRMIKIGFLDDEACEHALKVGMIFDNAEEKVRILPTLAMKPETSIVRLSLSNLPFVDPERLLTGIKSSLKPYGHIVDVGLSFDKAHQLYIGQGYAVIDTYQHSTVERDGKHQSLTHNIPWFGPKDSESSDDMELDDLSLYTREAGFYATWNNMPTWCTYCHDDSGDHTASTCQQRPGFQNVVCWECGKAGHYQTACPTPKKAKKGSLPTTTKIYKERQRRKPRDQRRRSRTPPSGRRETT